MSASVKIEGLDQLQKRLAKASKLCHKTDGAVTRIHKNEATKLAKKMRRRIKPASKDIVVKGAKRSPLVIERGTYRRSIAQWKPKRAEVDHLYIVGPRTGKKVGARRDAWFQLIVEQDKQFIKGNNRHAFVITDLLREETPKIAANLVKAYREQLRKRLLR